MTDNKAKNIINTVYEDSDYIAVNKPAGLLVIPDRFQKDLPNLYAILNEKYGKVFVVHRLDRDTSGIVCFAKNGQAHRELCLQFEKNALSGGNTADKTYWAIVNGCPSEKEGVVELPIFKSRNKPGTVIIDKRYGKDSSTVYKTLEEYKKYSLMEINPLTGRTHQIRIHFKSLGCAVAADPVYGDGKGIYLSHIKPGYKPNKGEKERPLMQRLALHALKLKFFHFGKKRIVELEAPLHRDFEITLKMLRKYSMQKSELYEDNKFRK